MIEKSWKLLTTRTGKWQITKFSKNPEKISSIFFVKKGVLLTRFKFFKGRKRP